MLRTFGQSSLISDPDDPVMKTRENMSQILNFDKAVDSKSDKHQNGCEGLKSYGPLVEQESKPVKVF